MEAGGPAAPLQIGEAVERFPADAKARNLRRFAVCLLQSGAPFDRVARAIGKPDRPEMLSIPVFIIHAHD